MSSPHDTNDSTPLPTSSPPLRSTVMRVRFAGADGCGCGCGWGCGCGGCCGGCCGSTAAAAAE